jgi:Cdc6-like AAA superfamily ATPase
MLPSKPKIFYGRESELASILKTLDQECARITILGPGGMGKTSLARAVLHHAEVTAKFEHRFFVPCDSATTSIEIAALIGDHIGLKPGKDLTQPLLRYFTGQSTCLLILDNLETVWEPMGSRVGVEELLSLLTDIAHLALLVSILLIEELNKYNFFIDYNARCRKTWKSSLDPSILGTPETPI